MKLGIFDLTIKPIGNSEFHAIVSYKQEILYNWGNFETKEAALSCAIQNCKKIFGAVLDQLTKPRFRVKTKVVDAVQWFPELEIEGVTNPGGQRHTAFYGPFSIMPGDWIVDGSVITDEVFKENYECLLLH